MPAQQKPDTNPTNTNIELVKPKPETIQEQKIRQFKQLSDFLEYWFYKPDMDAVKICLCAYVAHTYLQDNPVWLFIIGVPGSGKTSVAIRAVSYLPNTHELNNLSTNSFLSGYGEGNGVLGKLTKKYNGNGVLLFPDFTTLLTKKTDLRDEIVGQLRPMFDGKTSKEVGNKGESVSWKGKVTLLAAATPALEDYWQLNRNLGERFLYLRWRGGDDNEKTAEYASKQTGKEDVIHEEFQRKIIEYVDVDTLSNVSIENTKFGLAGLACIVAKLRTAVRREKVGNQRLVSGVDEPEMPTRIMKGLTMIARASATLDRRDSVNWFDLCLAKRVAEDSIPVNRRAVWNVLTGGEQLDYSVTVSEIVKKTGIHRTLVDRTIEDLVLLNIVTAHQTMNGQGNGDVWVKLTEQSTNYWDSTLDFLVADLDLG